MVNRPRAPSRSHRTPETELPKPPRVSHSIWSYEVPRASDCGKSTRAQVMHLPYAVPRREAGFKPHSVLVTRPVAAHGSGAARPAVLAAFDCGLLSL